MQLGEALFAPSWHNEISPDSLLRNFVNVVMPQVESYVGYGNKLELGLIFNPVVAESFLDSRVVQINDFMGLIQEAQTDKS
jgi:hypothetical protein